MTLHRVFLGNCPPQPWRNGGGTTREMLRWPTGGAPDTWTLRVAVADILRDGPFSPYPGIDRWFVVVEGGGAVLLLDRGERLVERGDEPLPFAGEAAPACHLIDGPSRDLNLMVRRGAGPARMARARAGTSLEGSTRWRGLFTMNTAQVDVNGVTQALAAGTLLWSDSQDASAWTLREATLAYWLQLND